MGTATKSEGRKARLKKGFPLADGRTTKTAPKTTGKKKRPAIDPGKGSGRVMKDKAEQLRRARKT